MLTLRRLQYSEQWHAVAVCARSTARAPLELGVRLKCGASVAVWRRHKPTGSSSQQRQRATVANESCQAGCSARNKRPPIRPLILAASRPLEPFERPTGALSWRRSCLAPRKAAQLRLELVAPQPAADWLAAGEPTRLPCSRQVGGVVAAAVASSAPVHC